jgi:DNA-binding beta-propeller fold protein YncE
VTTTSGIYPPTGFTFTIINTSSEAISHVTPFRGIPGELAVDSRTDLVYVVNGSGVIIYDGASGNEKGSIPLGEPLYALTVDETMNRLYATSAENLFEINLNLSPFEVRSFPLGGYALGLAVNPITHIVYATNYLSNTISLINATDGSLVKTVQLGGESSNPSKLAVDSASNKVYIATGRDSIEVIDGSKGGVITSVIVGHSPSANSTYAVAVDEARNHIYVATTPTPLITIIDGKTDSVIGTLRIDYSPYELAVDSTNGRLYVTDYHLLTVVEARELPSSQFGQAPELIAASILGVMGSLALWFGLRRFRHAETRSPQ